MHPRDTKEPLPARRQHRMANAAVHLLLPLLRPERRAFVEEHLDPYGARWVLRQLPAHLRDDLVGRLTGRR